jgi:hypothetical protein
MCPLGNGRYKKRYKFVTVSLLKRLRDGRIFNSKAFTGIQSGFNDPMKLLELYTHMTQ